MDTEARIEAARARLEENRAVLVRAKEAGPPCAQCEHFVRAPKLNGKAPEPHCGHPAYIQPHYSPETGQLVQTIEVPIGTARGPGGLCGFEATLFDPRPKSPLRHVQRAKEVALWGFIFLWASGLTWAAIIGGVRFLLD